MARVRLGAGEIGGTIELEAKRSTLWEIFDFPQGGEVVQRKLDPSLESSLVGMCLFASGGFGGAGPTATSVSFTGGNVSREGFGHHQ